MSEEIKTEDTNAAIDPEQALSSRFPTADTVLFLLIILVAGTCTEVQPTPRGFVDVMLAAG